MTTQRGYSLRFSATLQEMASSEIMEMVDAGRMATIKAIDPHPLIKAFVVGHEGESKGNIVGVGNVIKRWAGKMIRALGSKIRAGLQLFHGHAATNTHEGRIAIGEVVGTRLKDIDGRESIVVACHIKPEFRHLPLDVASVETDVDFAPNEDGTLDIVDVAGVTGIALSNSAIDKPGFPGATLLGQLQAFESSHNIKASGSRLRLGYSNTDKGRLAKVKLA